MNNISHKPGPTFWGRPQSNAVAFHSQETKSQVIELRKQGYTFSKIGQTIGISKTRAYQIVKEALDNAADQYALDASSMMQLELENLESLENKLWEVFDKSQNLKAAAIILQLMDQRAKLLGLYNRAEAQAAPFEVRMYRTVSPDDWDKQLTAPIV